MASSHRIGWIGLGQMGGPLAGRVSKALLSRNSLLTVFDTSSAALSKHMVAHGSFPATSLSDLGQNSDIVFLSLPTSTIVKEVIKNLAPHLTPDSIVVDCTSGDPITSREAAALLPCPYVDVPVSGGPAGAAAGTVTAMAGGDADAIATVREYIAAFAASLVVCGGVGAGHATKSVNNILNVGHLMLAGEGLLSLRGFGVEPDIALAAINASSGRSLQTQVRLPVEVLSGNFDYGFQIGLMLKDVRNATALSSKHHPNAALLPAIEKLLADAVESQGDPTVDYTRAVAHLETLAGFDLRSSSSSTSAAAPLQLKPPTLLKGCQLLVCDMAGTVVDEGGLVYTTLRECMNDVGGLNVSEEAMGPWHGAAKEAVVANFVKEAGGTGEDAAQLTAKVNGEFEERLRAAYLAPGSSLSLIDPSLPEYFMSLRMSGIQIGLNTGYPRSLQNAIIEKLRLNEMVDGWVSAQDVPAGRPSPFMVHRLMEKLGVEDVRRVAKAGDTERDMGEAKNAGCGQAIAVLSGADSEAALRAAGADVVVGNVTQLPLAEDERPLLSNEAVRAA